MRMWPIPPRVNKPESDDPAIVEPIELSAANVNFRLNHRRGTRPARRQGDDRSSIIWSINSTASLQRANIMITRREASTGLLSSAVLAVAPGLAAENATAIDLPPPRADGGKPLIRALRGRLTRLE